MRVFTRLSRVIGFIFRYVSFFVTGIFLFVFILAPLELSFFPTGNVVPVAHAHEEDLEIENEAEPQALASELADLEQQAPKVGFFQRLFRFLRQLLSIVTRTEKSSSATPAPSAPQAPAEEHTEEQKPTPPLPPPSTPSRTLFGTYRCWSYNVSGGSGNCRLAAPLVFTKDGRYSMSSEKGTYTVQGDIVTLSESKIRGPGAIVDGNKIRFEYTYNGLQHTITYLKSGEAEEKKKDTPANKKVSVDLTVHFPESENYADSVNVIALYDGITWIAESIAYAVSDTAVRAHFSRDREKGIITGKKYDVRVSNGFSTWSVGTLDLRSATKDVSRDIRVAPTKSETKKEEPTKTPSVAPEPPPSVPVVPVYEESSPTPDPNAPPCNPNIPRYSQPGCRE